ncbi:MAG: nucleotidyltransferase domain-containing protein [Chloroflexi bacterium]|nr:nucleotidyltransferase domain-containing protein [Chloroflexota bacterium]
MHQRYGAILYMFGSRVRGTARRDSDYDLVAVSSEFAGQHVMDRAPARRDLWIAAGGWRLPLDLHSYTPEEFQDELRGLGYLGQARRRGELVRVPLRRTANSRERRAARYSSLHFDVATRSAGARPPLGGAGDEPPRYIAYARYIGGCSASQNPLQTAIERWRYHPRGRGRTTHTTVFCAKIGPPAPHWDAMNRVPSIHARTNAFAKSLEQAASHGEERTTTSRQIHYL